ncbi:preprotein translocase subunit YajC [Agrococcus lahaulensis]|jgi:preprotein translocase subunit YajC|uniref:preprotein translocase subunit YajC n=1 Tax=Agrococcus sp. BE272 TaxID=2817727 RepID=UPI000FE3F394|nr:preprotein translocase subunit YajC [Agrococcus sp. BE272]MDR7234582.1 preprotein translocase subunit YajC [Agrococcus sp. BE272]RWR24876.1 preprotein translocase subunit YajC [Agrococcus lahaulensis]
MLFLQTTTTAQQGFPIDPLTLIMLVVLAAMIFFMFRSNKKRKAQAEELQSQMVPGAEVMTNFGLFGELTAIDEERNEALIEIAPGTIVRVHRQTLARVVDDHAEVVEDRGIDEAGDADEPRDRA